MFITITIILFLIIAMIAFSDSDLYTQKTGTNSLSDYANKNETKTTIREDAFYDYANKYVSQIAPPWLVKQLKPYAKKVVKRMLDLQKVYKAEGLKFKLSDEMKLIECSLELCLMNISTVDFYYYIANVNNASINNSPIHIKHIAEKLVSEFFD